MAVIRTAPATMNRPTVHKRAPSSTRLRRESGLFMSRPNAIPQAPDRLDNRCTQLAPESCDEDLDGVRVAVEVLGVDVLGQLALRDNAGAMVHQVGQDAELVTRQFDCLAITRHTGQPRIERHRTATDGRLHLP